MPGSDGVSALLEKMAAADTDFRFMALNDLINGLQNGTINIKQWNDPHYEKSLVRSVMHLLNDGHGEVQSLAVNAVSILFQNVSPSQASFIITELVSGLCTGENEMFKSICAVALKSLINSIQDWQEQLISLLTRELISPLIKAVGNEGDSIVQIEACELIGELMSKFGPQIKVFHGILLESLLFALCSKNATLRKRSMQAIDAFTAYEDGYSSLLLFVNYRFSSSMGLPDNDATILKIYPSLEATLRQPMSVSDFKITLQCLAILARNSDVLASQAPHLVITGLIDGILQGDPTRGLLLSRLKRGVGDGELEEVADEVRELALQILEVILRRRQRSTSARPSPCLLDNQVAKLVPLLLSLLKHDPNYNYPDDSEAAMDVDEDDVGGFSDAEDDFSADECDDDDDDCSWKVRRSAAKTIDALIQAYPEHLADFYASITPVLIQRFCERIESIRLEIFACMNSLLKATCIPSTNPNDLAARLSNPKTPQAQLLHFMPTIFRSINPYISSPAANGAKGSRGSGISNKTSPACHQAALSLIRGLGLALPGQLASHIGTILTLIRTDFNEPSTTNAVKIELVKLLLLIVKTHDFSSYAQHADLINKLVITAISDPFYRVSLDGMELAQTVVLLRPRESRGDLKALFPFILQQLQKTKCDLELKEKAVSTADVFVGCLGSDLPQGEVQQCLDLLLQHLKNETTRLVTMRAFSSILTKPLSVDPRGHLPELIRELTPLLVVKDRATRIAALRCLSVVCKRNPQVLLLDSPDRFSEILSALPALVSDQRFLVAQGAVHFAGELLQQSAEVDADVNEKVADLVASADFLEPIIALAHSSVLHGQMLAAILFLMRCIGHFKPPKQHHLSIPFVLSRLLQPLDAAVNRSAATSGDTAAAAAAVRESLPNLARITAELILQLPLCAPKVSGHLNSINGAIDDLLVVAKDPSTPDVKRYLNFLIFGEIGCKINLSDRQDVVGLLMTCLTTEADKPADVEGGGYSELRPFAATSLGRLAVGQPAKMLPFLLQAITDADQQHTEHHLVVFYLLQALREAIALLLENNATESVTANLDAIWMVLLSNAGRPEEGSRSLVAECLGRIAILAPKRLIPQLAAELNSPQVAASNLIRCTLVTAVKCLLSVSATSETPDDGADGGGGGSGGASAYFNRQDIEATLSTPGLLSAFLSRLVDVDADVCRAAFITLNTAAHHWSALIRPLLNQPLGDKGGTLLAELYRGTEVRQELIRVVQMGPFKVCFDDGIELRKTAYECMSTILDTFVEDLSMSDFIAPLINGLKDNNHVKLVVCHILQRVIQVSPVDVAQKMAEISGPLKEILQTKPKEDVVKQESEKVEEVRRCAIALIVDFQQLPDIKKNHHYNELLKIIQADSALVAMFKGAAASSTSSSSTTDATRQPRAGVAGQG
uniref:TIP120 domain-containing protein n=1 Tax=Mesocestoides corti TaxID=53468 RepID=A0A5K3FJZ9_MESCO